MTSHCRTGKARGGLYIGWAAACTRERIEKYLSLGVGRILGGVAVTDFEFTARMLQKYRRSDRGGRGRQRWLCCHPRLEEVSAEERGLPYSGWQRRAAKPSSTRILPATAPCRAPIGLYRQLSAEVPGVEFTASGGIPRRQSCWSWSGWGWRPPSWARASTPGRWILPGCVQLVQK